MLSLKETAHKHEEAILVHVNRLPVLADMVMDGPTEDFRAQFEEECRFIKGQLVPHIQAVEAALYPELERQLNDLNSLEPMRREHRDLNLLLTSLCHYRDDVEAGRLGNVRRVGLRRTLYRLYAIFKQHLAHERLFVDVLERGLPGPEKDALARALSHPTVAPV